MDSQNRLSAQALALPQAAQPRAQLPPLPSLEHLKKQAKHLLAACRRGDAAALARLQRWFPERSANAERPAQTTIALSQAQLALAREHGAGSWAHLRRAALTALVERLAVRHWSGWRTAAAARTALAQVGDDGVLAVVGGLSHPAPRVRRGAVEFLTHYPDSRSVTKLTELALRDAVPYVRRLAVTALTRQRGGASPSLPNDLAPLLGQMAREDSSARVRWKAVTLGLPTPELVRVAREDPSPRVRQRALKTLGGRRDSALARQALEAALRDGPPAEQRAAHDALRRVSPEYRELAARRAREANQARASAAGSARAAG